jgi:hypothetical protein
MNAPRVNEEMLGAGVATALNQLPKEMFDEHSVDPAAFVVAVFQAMALREWQPIETAPHGTANVMLGLIGPTDFKVGIGMWTDEGDDSGQGKWSTEAWWGQPPTHWRPMPVPPMPEAA